MYAGVPRITPSRVSRPAVASVGVESNDYGGSIAFASPKSRIFTLPSGVILMLAGFRSRCTMVFACASFERVGHLPRDPQNVIRAHRPLRRLAWNVLHHQAMK